MLARTWPGLILVLLLDVALMPAYVLVVGLAMLGLDVLNVIKCRFGRFFFKGLRNG